MPERSLDVRILRFRTKPEDEDAGALVRALFEAGRLRDVIEVAEVARQKLPSDLERETIFAYALFREGMYVEAQDAVTQLLRVKPRDPHILALLGEVLLKRGDPMRAQKALEKALVYNPRSSDLKARLERVMRLSKIAEQSGANPPTAETAVPAARRGQDIFRVATRKKQGVPPPLVSSANLQEDQALKPTLVEPPPLVPSTARQRPHETLTFEGEDTRRARAAAEAFDEQPTSTMESLAGEATRRRRTPMGLPPVGDEESFEAEEPTGLNQIAPKEDRDFSIDEETQDSFEVDEQTHLKRPKPAQTAAFEQVEFAAGLVEERSVRMREADTTKDVWRLESPPARTRTGGPMAIICLVAIALLAFAGWRWFEWYQSRRTMYAHLSKEASVLFLKGGYANLVRAERNLLHARKLRPVEVGAVEGLLQVRLALLLEEGRQSTYPLKPLALALKRVTGKSQYVELVSALEAVRQGRNVLAHDVCLKKLAQWSSMTAYLCARIIQIDGPTNSFAELIATSLRANRPPVGAYLAKAESAADDAQYALAETTLKQALALYPQNPRVQLWLSYVAALQDRQVETKAGKAEGKVDRALALLRQLHFASDSEQKKIVHALEEVFSSGFAEPRLLHRIAEHVLELGFAEPAAQASAKALAFAPGTLRLRLTLARAHFASGADAMALRTIQGLGSSDPHILALKESIHLHVRDDEGLRQAVRDTEAYAESHPNLPAELRYAHARALAALGNLSEAERLLQADSGDKRGRGWLALARADLALRRKETSVAKRWLEEAAKAKLNVADLELMMAQVYENRGEFETAIAHYRRALELSPWFAPAALHVAQLQERGGHWQDAAKAYEDAIKLAGTGRGLVSNRELRYQAQIGRLRVLLALNQISEAQKQFDRLSPEDRERLEGKIIGLKLAQLNGKGAREYKEISLAKHEAEQNAQTLAMLGDVQFAMGRFGDAKDSYEKAMDKEGSKVLALIGLAAVEIKLDDQKQAFERLHAAEQAFSSEILPKLWLSKIYSLRGQGYLSQKKKPNAKAAQEWLKKATSQTQVDPEAYFWLGEAFAKENAEEARQAYNRYLELAPEGAYAARATKALKH